MLVPRPFMKMTVGRIYLVERIDINTWKERHNTDKEAFEIIDIFLKRNTCAMPVLSFQMTREIELELETLHRANPNFACSQMYYYLGKYSELFE